MWIRFAVWLWPWCALAQVSAVTGSIRGVYQWATQQLRSPEAARPAAEATTTFDELSAGVQSKVDAIVVGKDLLVTESLRVAHDLEVSSTAEGPFALDGGDAVQVFTVDGGNLVLKDIIVKRGSSLESGGAIAVLGGSLELIKCTVRQSSARDGGAVYGSDSATIRATQCNFIANSAVIGGAISLYQSSMVLSDCAFVGNRADEAGGAISASASSVRAEYLTAEDNSAATFGGAISMMARGQLNAVHCHLVNNRAASADTLTSRGGAVYLAHSNATIQSCRISGNVADVGGALATLSATVFTFTTTWNQNSANYGGALALATTGLADDGSAVNQNTASVAGGAVFLSAGAVLNTTDTDMDGNTPENVARDELQNEGDLRSSRSEAEPTDLGPQLAEGATRPIDGARTEATAAKAEDATSAVFHPQLHASELTTTSSKTVDDQRPIDEVNSASLSRPAEGQADVKTPLAMFEEYSRELSMYDMTEPPTYDTPPPTYDTPAPSPVPEGGY